MRRDRRKHHLRFELGRLLIEREDWLEAERVFRSFYQYDFVYTTQALFYLGQVYEALGRREAAAEHYARFTAWWEYADPELQPWVEEAREALVRLGPLDQ